jgi:hypothetical protein
MLWYGRSRDAARPTGQEAGRALDLRQCLVTLLPVNVDDKAAQSEQACLARSRRCHGDPLYHDPLNEWRYRNSRDGTFTLAVTHQDGRSLTFKVSSRGHRDACVCWGSGADMCAGVVLMWQVMSMQEAIEWADRLSDAQGSMAVRPMDAGGIARHGVGCVFRGPAGEGNSVL